MNEFIYGLTTCDMPLNCENEPGIYFISDGNGHIKIGKTNNVGRRLNELQTAQANTLRLLQFIKAPTKDLDDIEKTHHQMFRHCKLKGEWFEEAPVLDYLVATCHFLYGPLATVIDIESGKFIDLRETFFKESN